MWRSAVPSPPGGGDACPEVQRLSSDVVVAPPPAVRAPAVASATQLVRAAVTAWPDCRRWATALRVGYDRVRRIAALGGGRSAKGEIARGSARSPLPLRLALLLGVCVGLSLVYAPPAPAVRGRCRSQTGICSCRGWFDGASTWSAGIRAESARAPPCSASQAKRPRQPFW